MCSWRCLFLECRSRVHVGRLAYEGRVGLQHFREMPARTLDEIIPVDGEDALHRRIKVVGKVARVLTS
jgi:hypothetical protein